MLKTETRQIAQREKSILEAAVAGGVHLVTARGTATWVTVWTAGLCLVGLLAYLVVSRSPRPIVGGLLAGLLLVVAILCVYAIIALVSGYFHWSRVSREFRQRDAPEIRAALADGRIRVTRVEAGAVVTIQEYEDEGAGFVFDVGDGKLFFVKGQRYWPAEEGTAWPNSAFEIVRTVVGDRWVGIFCQGEHLEPMEILQTADCREDVAWAEREEIVEAGLADFVRSIRRAAQQGDEADEAR